MTSTGTADDAYETETSDQPGLSRSAAWRQLAVIGLVVALVGGALTLFFVAAFHAPKPHQLPIAVKADAATIKTINIGVATTYGDTFALHAVPDELTGLTQLKNREVYAFLVVNPDGKGQSYYLNYAGPNGLLVNDVIAGAFNPNNPNISYGTANAVRGGTGDLTGLSVFFSVLSATVAGLVFGGLLLLPRLRRLRVVDAVLALLVASAVTGAIGSVLLSETFDALPGSILGVVLFGLLVFASASATYALGRLFALRGLLVAGLIVGGLGVASSGLIFPPPYLPDAMRPFASLLPPGLAGQAIVGNAYFNDHAVTQGLVGLIVWVLVALLLVVFAANGGFALLKRKPKAAADEDDFEDEDAPAEA